MRYIRQEGIRDCGVCSLLNIIRYYGGNISVEKLRVMTNTNENGTSIYNLVNCANKLGFKAKAYNCNIDNLDDVKLPLIGLIKIENYNHFVIINSIKDDKIQIFDPIRGYVNYTRFSFDEVFQKIIIVFEKNGEIVKEEDIYYSYIKKLIEENKKIIILICILSLVCAIFSLITSAIIKNVFDGKMGINFLLLFIIVLKILFEYLKNRFSIFFDNKINYYISNKINTKIFSLPLTYHHSRPVGDITSKINDLYSIEEFIRTFTFSTIIDVLFIILTLFITLFISLKIFLTIIVISIILIGIFLYFRNGENNLMSILKNNYAEDNSILVDNIYGIDTIKNLAIEDKVIDKQNNTKLKYLKSYNKYVSYLSYENIFTSFVESYGIIFILVIGIKKMSVGTLTMTYSIFISYIISLKNIINLVKLLDKSKISYRNINKLLNYKYNDGNKIIKDINSISFNNISYSYNKNRIITDLNFTINKGDRVLIKGNSGSGKSTIFKILTKELMTKKGNILVNNINIDEIKTNSLKNNITYVSQNEYLFNDTIKNNITMYKSFKEKDLNKVLKVTMLDKVLKNRNISLDYLLEENGHNLSGGERQKILIARTLLRNSSLIIFDETTNEIDNMSEEIILKNIINEYHKTLVIISHKVLDKRMFNKVIEV